METYDSDLCFFMREDESGDVWLYTDDVNTLGHISGNKFYYDIDQNYASGLVRHDLFLFNTRKPYSAGDKKPFGTIAFDSPEALYDGHNLFDWCIDSLKVKDVTGSVMLDGKEHWVSIYDYDLKYVQGIGPLWAGPLSGVGSFCNRGTFPQHPEYPYRQGHEWDGKSALHLCKGGEQCPL